MNAFLSWFRGSKNPIDNDNADADTDPDVGRPATENKSTIPELSLYNVVDAYDRTVVGDLTEGQAINYCLQYRLQGEEVFILEQSPRPSQRPAQSYQSQGSQGSQSATDVGIKA